MKRRDERKNLLKHRGEMRVEGGMQCRLGASRFQAWLALMLVAWWGGNIFAADAMAGAREDDRSVMSVSTNKDSDFSICRDVQLPACRIIRSRRLKNPRALAKPEAGPSGSVVIR